VRAVEQRAVGMPSERSVKSDGGKTQGVEHAINTDPDVVSLITNTTHRTTTTVTAIRVYDSTRTRRPESRATTGFDDGCNQ